MAPKTLVEKDIELGKRLLEKLDERGVHVDAALWAYDSESERYQLVVASGTVPEEGARQLFEKVRDALQELPEDERVSFSDITVANPYMGIVASLSTRVNTPADAVDGIRITDGVVNREFIEDVHIYRMCVGEAPHSAGTG